MERAREDLLDVSGLPDGDNMSASKLESGALEEGKLEELDLGDLREQELNRKPPCISVTRTQSVTIVCENKSILQAQEFALWKCKWNACLVIIFVDECCFVKTAVWESPIAFYLH